MLPETLSARSYRFAVVYNGQPEMSRSDNLNFYDRLTAKGVELPTFEQKKTEIMLQNLTEGAPRNILRINVGYFKDKFRLLVLEDNPSKSMEIFQQTADAAWGVLSDVWQPLSKGGLFLVETNLMYTAASEGGNATNFLLNNCLRIPKEAMETLGRPVNGVGIRLVSPVLIAPDGKPPLPNADFNVTIETLLEDPSRLYIQVIAKWPSLPLPAIRTSEGSGIKSLPSYLNPECKEPSWYLKQVEAFVKEKAVDFLKSAKK